MRRYQTRLQPLMAMIMAFAIFAMPVSVFSQTQIKLHSNKYKVSDDIKLGRQAAQEVEQKMPVLRDQEVTNYVERVGERLASAIPSQFQHPGFDYYFRVINARDINAFALPGGQCTSTGE
jgi:predicted Zn-dependent protease